MDKLYAEYSKIVYKYLFSLTNNPEIAEELMQETFYSAIKNINKFRKDSSIKTWLCKIAKNKWIDYCKKKYKISEVNIDDINENLLFTETFENNYTNRDELLNLYNAIHKLDEKSKEVIYLRIRSDLTFKEIGFILGKSEEWARVTFYRAKIKLKEEFKHEEE